MKAYYFVFFIMLLVSLFFQAKDDRQWRWKLFWTFLPLFIYGAIRVDYGNDYPVYEAFYNEMHNVPLFTFDFDIHAEVGFQLLNQLLPTFRLLLVISAFLLCFALAHFCYHIIPQKYLWLTIVLIFLNPDKIVFADLVGIRNGLVISLFLIGFVFIQQRKIWQFAILTIVSSFIHTSALFFMPIAYFVGVNKEFKKKEVFIWAIVTVVLLSVSMTSLFEIVFSIISNDYFNRYEYYLEDTSMHRGVLSIISNLFFVSMFIGYLLKHGKDLNESQNSLVRLGLLYSVMAFLGSLSMRSSSYYGMFYIATVVFLFSNNKRVSPAYRYALVFMAIFVSCYSMFRVWMGSVWWNHEVYHSLIGNW